MLFRQAFCAASTCSASRACLLTGQYAHSNGMLGLAHRGWSLNDYNHHIVHTLHDIGYHSVLIGEQHISKRPDVIGYDQVIKIATTRASDVAPVTIDVLRDPPGRPFFLSVGLLRDAPRVLPARAPGEERYVLPPPNLPGHSGDAGRHGGVRRERAFARRRRSARCSTRSTTSASPTTRS